MKGRSTMQDEPDNHKCQYYSYWLKSHSARNDVILHIFPGGGEGGGGVKSLLPLNYLNYLTDTVLSIHANYVPACKGRVLHHVLLYPRRY